MNEQTVFRVTFTDGSSCCYGVESLAHAAARKSGVVEAITIHGINNNVSALRLCVNQLLHDGVPVDPDHLKRIELYSAAGQGVDIDDRYAGRLALLLECMLIDPNEHWNEAAMLLDEYKAEWGKVNPQPPLFMGEPMPPERRARLIAAMETREIAASQEKPE